MLTRLWKSVSSLAPAGAASFFFLLALAGVTSASANAANNPVPKETSFSPSQLLTGSTQTVTVVGSGFVSGTVVMLNGGALATTYQNSTHLTAKVPVSQFSKGSISVQLKSPAPGGGWGTVFSIPIQTNKIVLTAKGPNGTNASTTPLGSTITMSAAVSGTANTAIKWRLDGADVGSISSSGVYTAPTRIANGTVAKISAVLVANTSIVASYSVSLVNPVPTETSSSPAQLIAGKTQAVAIVGSGFVSGTVAVLNGVSLSTTFTDFHHVTAQVPVSATANTSLTLQMRSPSPGGGWGTIFKVGVTKSTIVLSATGLYGASASASTSAAASTAATANGRVGLGSNVAMHASVTGSALTAVTWKISGAGSITSGGVYTAPTVMPSSSAVTVTATLASNSAITSSFAVTLVNSVPEITDSNPIMVPAGATTSVTLTGTGFVSGTEVLVNNTAVTTTYNSPTSVVAKIAVASGTTGSLTLQAKNPTPGGGTGDEFDQAVSAATSATAAARILDQTTFGPTASLIQHVQKEGIDAWLAEQFNTAPAVFAQVPTNFPAYCHDAAYCATSEWWQDVLTGNDQLRQRVAFALSEIFVISVNGVPGQALPSYTNMLAKDAFSNWYTIMKDVTLSPAMGNYLNMLGSYKPTGNLIANENYARENMQLFNMGPSLLNQSGSLQVDSYGNPKPAYSEAQVEAFARAYTGWTYANPDGSTPDYFIGTSNWTHPMVAVEKFHDETSKTLLNGTVLPAGQTAEQDLSGALNNIFQHRNVPPFVCKQLIQHLVMSNPSPSYVTRVANVFADNGNHVRGDMQAVLTAIFTDPEARLGDTEGSTDDGHLREPVLWMSSVARGLGFVNIDPNNFYDWFSYSTRALSEEPFAASSVFNFYPPSYVIPGTDLSAPEFSLENTGSVTDRLTLADAMVNNHITNFNVDLSATSPLGQLASNPGKLVDQLGLIFMHSQMDSGIRSTIVSEISGISSLPQRVRTAAYLVITSSQYKIAE